MRFTADKKQKTEIARPCSPRKVSMLCWKQQKHAFPCQTITFTMRNAGCWTVTVLNSWVRTFTQAIVFYVGQCTRGELLWMVIVGDGKGICCPCWIRLWGCCVKRYSIWHIRTGPSSGRHLSLPKLGENVAYYSRHLATASFKKCCDGLICCSDPDCLPVLMCSTIQGAVVWKVTVVDKPDVCATFFIIICRLKITRRIRMLSFSWHFS